MILKLVFISITTAIATTNTLDVFNESKVLLPVILNSTESQSQLSSSDLVMTTESNSSFDYFVDYIHKNIYLVEELTEKCWSLVWNGHRAQVWGMSVLCSTIIGVSSMFPLLLISLSDTDYLVNSDSSSKTLLKYLLSFAVGGLLGDVFLHLLPEASDQMLKTGLSLRNVQLSIGFWILTGILCFAFAETFASHLKCDSIDGPTKGQVANGCQKNGDIKRYAKPKTSITGYLNILANGFDNLTHGLAVGASFLVSIKMGLLTTIAIAIHEIPHEIADFAILIKSGFSKWEAVRAQVSIAFVTVLGALAILLVDSADAVGTRTAWILPFTSGGFLHISLVSILPELLAEHDFRQSVTQGFIICAGVAVMALVNTIAD